MQYGVFQKRYFLALKTTICVLSQFGKPWAFGVRNITKKVLNIFSSFFRVKILLESEFPKAENCAIWAKMLFLLAY